MSIVSKLQSIQRTIPDHVTLVAVSKTKPVADLVEAYAAGQRIFGENKIQEMTEKWQAMPKDIQWHMIGHVQSNKVKYMVPYVKLIHGVDSLKLLVEINRHAIRWRKHINCLLQIHIAEEETKFGLNAEELDSLLSSEVYKSLTNVNVIGLMGMASFTEDQAQIKREFEGLKALYDRYSHFTVLSMGMSGDYALAIACGSTMVRVGSSIFGTR